MVTWYRLGVRWRPKNGTTVRWLGCFWCLTLKSLLAMTCFGYSSIKIDKYSNSTAIDRGKVKFIFIIVWRIRLSSDMDSDSPGLRVFLAFSQTGLRKHLNFRFSSTKLADLFRCPNFGLISVSAQLWFYLKKLNLKYYFRKSNRNSIPEMLCRQGW